MLIWGDGIAITQWTQSSQMKTSRLYSDEALEVWKPGTLSLTCLTAQLLNNIQGGNHLILCGLGDLPPDWSPVNIHTNYSLGGGFLRSLPHAVQRRTSPPPCCRKCTATATYKHSVMMWPVMWNGILLCLIVSDYQLSLDEANPLLALVPNGIYSRKGAPKQRSNQTTCYSVGFATKEKRTWCMLPSPYTFHDLWANSAPHASNAHPL